MSRRQAFTLIELVITMVISTLALLALSVPFMAERTFWGAGNRQTEAQRDAQVALRALGRAAREASSYAVMNPGPTLGQLTVTGPGGVTCVTGGPAAGGQLLLGNGCADPAPLVLIDGVRSRVASLQVTPAGTRLVRVRLLLQHRLRVTDVTVEDELVETELYLRNAT